MARKLNDSEILNLIREIRNGRGLRHANNADFFMEGAAAVDYLLSGCGNEHVYAKPPEFTTPQQPTNAQLELLQWVAGGGAIRGGSGDKPVVLMGMDAVQQLMAEHHLWKKVPSEVTNTVTLKRATVPQRREGVTYYYFLADLSINCTTDSGTQHAAACFAAGNYFLSKNEAERAADAVRDLLKQG